MGCSASAPAADDTWTPPDNASPVVTYKEFASSGAALRTGFTHFYGGLNSSISRTAAQEFRQLCRDKKHTGQTSGFAPGFVQANFVMLDKAYAYDFIRFAMKNPKAMPLLAVTDPGDPEPRNIAPGANVCTDIPKYRVWKDGVLVDEPNDVSSYWNENMVGFLIGCSFSWENKLKEAGLCPRQIEEGKNVPMFLTNIDNQAVGIFKGKTVVSLRPYNTEGALAAARLTGSYPGAHGGPIHWGDPSAIGIDPARVASWKGDPDPKPAPDWGDAVTLKEDDIPVFWACGVTPQTAIEEAGKAGLLPFAVTHAPGHMFIADVTDGELFVDTPLKHSYGH